MKSIYKKILSIGLLSAFLEFALANQAHAGLFTIDGLTSAAITIVAQVVLGILSFFAQGFFIVSGFLIELAMKLNNGILDPVQNVFVFKGWTVFVNVADLALVVGLIIIAFATMLNFDSYGMKKTLPKLIVVALLVNFSLVIPGVLIDLSGMVTDFFVQQAGLNGSSMSSSLASAFNISGFLSTAKLGAGASAGQMAGLTAGKLGAGIMNILMNMAFIVVFTAVATVIMLTLAIMLFLRYFMLSFLLLMTPVIFVTWIFPGTKSHWDDWWNKFIRWTMFPPVMVFFMWLSLTAINATSAPQNTTTGSAGDLAQKLMNFNLSSLINMAMAVMLMILSLTAANSISIKGAKGSKDMIGSMTGWGRGKIDSWGKSSAAYGRREGERLARRTTARPAAAIGRSAERFRKYEGEKGGVRGFAAGIAGRVGERVSAAHQASLKKAFDDKFKGMSDANLAMRYSTMGADEKVFAAQQLASKGKLNAINGQILDRDISDKDAKATFDKYGGEGSYGKITKAAGRNDAMIKAKKAVGDIDSDTTLTGFQKMSKKADAMKAYKKEAAKFYKDFSKKDYEALGDDFYSSKNLKEGMYGREAMAAMLLNEPGAFANVTRNIGKGSEMKDFMKEVEKIRAGVKNGIMEGIRASLKPEDLVKLSSETNKELLEIMKELKASKDDIEAAKMYDNKTILAWIESKDAKVFKNIGGPSGITNLEDQMRLLHLRNNEAFTQMDEHQDYQHMARIQESMRKSAARRMYAESEEKKV